MSAFSLQGSPAQQMRVKRTLGFGGACSTPQQNTCDLATHSLQQLVSNSAMLRTHSVLARHT